MASTATTTTTTTTATMGAASRLSSTPMTAAWLLERRMSFSSAAAETGIPQVILPGAIDMVNFGPPATVPERFKGRTLTSHTPHATLLRTTVEENIAIAEFIAAKLNRATGPAAVVLPLRGFSAYDVAGGPFFDPKADAAFCDTLTKKLNPAIQVERIDAHINDRAVIDRATTLLIQMISNSIGEP